MHARRACLERMELYQEETRRGFEYTLGWLRQWACSRSFGLGTRLPWDPQYLIESLSDSTIYMAYYTVAHLLQRGDMYGQTGAVSPSTPWQGSCPCSITQEAHGQPLPRSFQYGNRSLFVRDRARLAHPLECIEHHALDSWTTAQTPVVALAPAIVLRCLRCGKPPGGGVKAADLTDEVWDYIFLGGQQPQNSPIPAQTLQAMRREFEFWYPFDLRVGSHPWLGDVLQPWFCLLTQPQCDAST